MELFRYLNVIKKRILLIVLLTIIGGAASYGFSLRQHKIYSATATLLINAAAPSSLIPFVQSALSGAGGVAPVQGLANTYDVYLKTRSFDATVVNKLGLGVTPDQLGSHISSALIPGTNYYQISVTWGDPHEAAFIATRIAQLFVSDNAAQTQTQNNNGSLDVSKSLGYFQKQITKLQQNYQSLVSNPKTSQAQLTQAEDRLSNLTDTYYRLLGLSGTSNQSASANTAILSDSAVAPTAPIYPRVSRNVLAGLFAGLLLGLALAFLLDFLDYSAHTPEDIEQLLGQAPLGVVGQIGIDSPATQRRGLFGRPKKPTPAPAANGNGNGKGAADLAGLTPVTVLHPQLVTLNHPKASITESFRTLRTNLDFSSLDKPLKSLVVTSSVPSEGKSTISANLAVAEAQAGKRVILVDADLRRPTVGRIFGLKRDTGLTTVLLHREDRAQAIDAALQPTVVPNLLVMTCGPHPPNPAELLASQSATDLIHELEARCDLLIFDTPPMGPLTDAVVLSARVDGTLLVARAASTRRNVINNSVSTIKKVGGNVVGTVLNMVNLKEISSYSYYYYYNTEYYYGREEQATGGSRKG